MTAIRQAVILAAGMGTRMKDLTRETPKPLLKVGGVPLIDRVLGPLIESGIEDVVVVTGYLAGKIEAHLPSAHPNARIRFIRQEKMNGTGGAMRIAAPLLRREPFVLTFGDILTESANYGGMYAKFRDRPCDLLMAVWDIGDPYRGAAITLDGEDRIVGIVEKPPQGTAKTPWINAGIFFSRVPLLDYLSGMGVSVRGEVELPDAFNMWREAGGDLRGYRLADYWSDVGTPEDLERMNRKLQGEAVAT